jgi:hypothetical protein
MAGQTFVYRSKTLALNELWVHRRRVAGPGNPSESLVESGLRHPAGKTFRAEREDAANGRADYVCDQSAARASAGGIDRNSTPTR